MSAPLSRSCQFLVRFQNRITKKCKTLSHYYYQEFEHEDQWRERSKLPYIYIQGCSNDDGNQAYVTVLKCPLRDSGNGAKTLTQAAKHEMSMKNVPLRTDLHKDFINPEQTLTNTVVYHCHCSNKTMLHSNTNGDGLFNLSILLNRDESCSTELHNRCDREIVKENILHSWYQHLICISLSYGKEGINCYRQGTDFFMLIAIAASHLLNHYKVKVPDMLLRPSVADLTKGILNLMWTSKSLPTQTPFCVPWHSDHIVPLVHNVKRLPSLSMASCFAKVWNRKLERQSVLSTFHQIQCVKFSTDIMKTDPEETNTIGDNREKYLKDRTLTSVSGQEKIKLQDSTEQKLHTARNNHPLPNEKLLSAEDLYKIIIEKENICQWVPPGDKSNSYILVDNTRNISRLKEKKKCEFFDDCGVWDSKKGNTVKIVYVIMDDFLRSVRLKNGQYCTALKQKGENVWKPLEPQPSEDEVVILHRYYATSKTNQSFKKRVSYFTCTAAPDIGNVAVYEYTGEQPVKALPHGLSRRDRAFIRTLPTTIEVIKEKLKDKSKKPREIFAELKADNLTDCLRDFNVILNQVYFEKKKSRRTTKRKAIDME